MRSNWAFAASVSGWSSTERKQRFDPTPGVLRGSGHDGEES
jgi:hypothetical protein